MQKLPISIGILSWHSGQVLVDTLTTYYENGLFDMVNDVTILFQEVTPQDIYRIIPLCLRHRLRKDPLESIDSGDKVSKVFKEVFEIEN